MAKAVLEYNNVTTILGNDVVVLGRSLESTIVLEDTEASRVHALILPNGDRYILLDFKSANGTKVNSRYITWCYLQDGDIIELSNERLKFTSTETTGCGPEEAKLLQLRAGRYDVIMDMSPHLLSAETRQEENPRLFEVIELHKLSLDLAAASKSTMHDVLTRGFETAQRLFNAKRAMVLVQKPGGGWSLVFAQGWKDKIVQTVAGQMLAQILFAAEKDGWPTLERMGMKSLLGTKGTSETLRPKLSSMGLPFMWDGGIKGLYYAETGVSSTLHSSTFTTFVDFLFTLTPPLRRAYLMKANS